MRLLVTAIKSFRLFQLIKKGVFLFQVLVCTFRTYALGHREGEARGDPLWVSERTALPERTHCICWIATSLAPLTSRNDKDRVGTEPHTPIPFHLCHREGEARGDPL